MMNYSAVKKHQQYIPMTPASSRQRQLKRILPKTPGNSSTVEKRRRDASQQQIPRTVGHGTPQSQVRHRGTMLSTISARKTMSVTVGEDRFIPNRAKTDVSMARRTLLQARQQQSSDENTTSDDESPFKCHVRRVLFDNDQNRDGGRGSMLSFESTATKKTETSMVRDDPRDHDLFRLSSTLMNGAPQKTLPFRPPRVTIKPDVTLEAPGMIQEAKLTLVDCSSDGSMVVALRNDVYLWKEGDAKKLDIQGDPFSCVRFSENGEYIALGQRECCQIVETKTGELVQDYFNYSGYVTAFAWRGTILLSAGVRGIVRQDALAWFSFPSTYQGHKENAQIHTLEWHSNTIVSAGNDDLINVYDANETGADIKPLHTMEHEDVSCVAYSPGHPNTLVSAGDKGLCFWNIQNGLLRGTIETEERAVGAMILNDDNPNEILVAHGNMLTIWNFYPKVMKVSEASILGGNGKIISLARGTTKGEFIVATSDEELTMLTIQREPSGKKRVKESNLFGGLRMQVIR